VLPFITRRAHTLHSREDSKFSECAVSPLQKSQHLLSFLLRTQRGRICCACYCTILTRHSNNLQVIRTPYILFSHDILITYKTFAHPTYYSHTTFSQPTYYRIRSSKPVGIWTVKLQFDRHTDMGWLRLVGSLKL